MKYWIFFKKKQHLSFFSDIFNISIPTTKIEHKSIEYQAVLKLKSVLKVEKKSIPLQYFQYLIANIALFCLFIVMDKQTTRKRGIPLKGKNGRNKQKKPLAKKKAVKKRVLSPEVKLQKRVTALRNLSKKNPALKEQLKREASLAELTLQEQVAKQHLATKTAEDQLSAADKLDKLFKDLDYDPAIALIEMIKRTDLKPNEEINIHKTLLNKKYGDVKSIDIQGKIDSTITVRLQSFADATTDNMKAAHQVIDAVDADYEEFEELEVKDA
ncbi:MAG: hypothetical protein CMJ25_18395 [Phycisphaerae bacterium]|nr:hypothetical protein [Phycisphaerae bacterium]